MSAGMTMWTFNQACWAWFEVIARKPLPDPFPGDIVLFLHVVPIMAAVAIRPQHADEREGMLPSTLNVIILLVWWIVVYAFFVFPDEYVVTDIAIYNPRWDLFYFLEGMILIAVSASAFVGSSGPWRKVYRDIFFASALYTFSSEAMNAAIARGQYRTGSIYDLPFVAAALCFLWVAITGRRCLRDIQGMPSIAGLSRPVAPQMAALALLSLPVMGYWALFQSHDQPYLRQVRFTAAMAGVALMAFFVFLKQHLLDRRLVQLLEHSRQSFDNLHRLHGRVIQQAKLASLGELVALAAGELEYPLSAILSSSEHMAASSNLSREQLANAQKIGSRRAAPASWSMICLASHSKLPEKKIRWNLNLCCSVRCRWKDSSWKIRRSRSPWKAPAHCRAFSEPEPTAAGFSPDRRERSRRLAGGRRRSTPGRALAGRERGCGAVRRLRSRPAQSRARFRSLLHHQTRRQRHRSRTQRNLWRDPGSQRTNHLLQPSRRRSRVRNSPSRSQSVNAGSGSGARVGRSSRSGDLAQSAPRHPAATAVSDTSVLLHR